MQTSPPLILALGDSLIAGYGLPPADGFPRQLERSLRLRHPGATVIDAGISGETTADVLRRLPAVLSALDRRPDLAIVQVGPNDLLRRVPPAAARANLDAILSELDRCGIAILLTTVAPPPVLLPAATAYLHIHEEVAARHGATTCPFFPPGVLGHPEMVLWDRIHPNARAIAAVVEAMLPAIRHALAREPAPLG